MGNLKKPKKDKKPEIKLQYVREAIAPYTISLDGEVIQTIAKLNKIIETHPKAFISEQPVGYEAGTELRLYNMRLETIEEAQRRIDAEKQHQEAMDKIQRKQYEELKKKFG